MKEYPVSHDFSGTVGLSMEDETRNTFILPILSCDESLAAPENVDVHPGSVAFDGVPGAAVTDSVRDNHHCFPRSVVNRIQIESFMNCDIGTTDIQLASASQQINYNVFYYAMLIKWAMDDPIDPDDDTISGTSLDDIIPIIRDVNNSVVEPKFSGVDLFSATDASTDIQTGGSAGQLTTDQKWEGVAFDQDLFEKIMKFGTLSGLIKSVTGGGLKKRQISVETPRYENLWMDNPSKTKRMNKNTFFGLLIHVPQVDSQHQFYHATNMTAIEHLTWSFHVRYNEYNDLFNQAGA